MQTSSREGRVDTGMSASGRRAHLACTGVVLWQPAVVQSPQ